jgi:hypothetical protein
MKKIFLMAVTGISVLWTACNNADAHYIDLNTGKTVKLEKDESGDMINVKTREPVYIYVDTRTHDTIYGKNGKIINGHVIRTGDNSYSYDADVKTNGGDAYKAKDDDYKMKVEKDGDIKIKNGDTKTKIDGETGKKKTKND